MYELSRNLPHELIYKRKPNIPVGIAFFIVGVLGEILTLYIYIFIINSTSFAESSFILNLLITGDVPLSFFISLAGALCLGYALLELFFSKGWIVSYSESTDQSMFFTFWQVPFYTSTKIIPKENINQFIIEVIYYDQLKLTNRKRLLLDYQDPDEKDNQKILLYEEVNTDTQSDLRQIIKDFNLILKKEIIVIVEEIESKVIETED